MNDTHDDDPATTALLRRLVAEQVAEAPVPRPWSEVTSAEPRVERALNDARRPRVLVFGVAASLIALVGALVVVANRPIDEAEVAIDVAVGVPLAEVEALDADQWVVPTEVPGQIEYQYAMRLDAGASRSVNAGRELAPEALVVRIEPAATPLFGSVDIDVDGRAWAARNEPGGWAATAQIGDRAVTVYGPGTIEVHAVPTLSGLTVVATDDLPYPPLDPDGPMNEVASYELDGDRWSVEIQESNGYVCSRFQSDEGGRSSGCGGALVGEASSDVFLSFVGGGGYEYSEDATVIRANDWGVVRDDVERVDVEFIDGSIVSVEPTNPTDRFDGLRFWVVVADVQLTDGRDPDDLTPVRELRAFDGAGDLLGTRQPGDDGRP